MKDLAGCGWEFPAPACFLLGDSMRLFLDISRLHQRAARSTPSGIDRVEFAYLSHTLDASEWPHEVVHVLSPRLVAGALRPERAQEIHRQIEKSWSSTSGPGEEATFLALKLALEQPVKPLLKKALRFSAAVAQQGWSQTILNPRDLLRAGVRLKRRVNRLGEKKNVYVHTSHSFLDKPHLFDWLRAHRIPAVFFLHDVIPIDFPEFCRPGEAQRHLTRLRTIAELASLVLVNSDYTARVARTHFAANGWPVPPFATVPLGVGEWFQSREGLDPPQAAHPYAVFVGTIEPRKNLAFLLAVWRRLAEQYGDQTPRLVIVGRRGWENENVLDFLERSSMLAPFIIEINDLNDAGVASVIAGARALLAPSFVEGFNLPVVEGLALGARVIASDIEVHREIAGGHATLVDALDGPAWARAIAGACGLEPEVPRPAPPAAFKALTWAQHVGLAMQVISDRLARPQGSA